LSESAGSLVGMGQKQLASSRAGSRGQKYGHSRGRGSTNVDDPDPDDHSGKSRQETLRACTRRLLSRHAWHEFCFFLFRLGVPPQAYEGPPLVWCVRPDQGLGTKSRGMRVKPLPACRPPEAPRVPQGSSWSRVQAPRIGRGLASMPRRRLPPVLGWHMHRPQPPPAVPAACAREIPSASHGRCAGRLGPMPCARRQRSERKRAFSRRSASVSFAVLLATGPTLRHARACTTGLLIW
jgi:hypothetical protein